MEALGWISKHWTEFLQSTGIIAGLFFTAYSAWKEAKAREIGHMIAIADQHRQIWKELYERPKLARVLEKAIDLDKKPVSHEEELFVTLLILHLDKVHRAMKAGMFITLEGLQSDIEGFFSLPIPKAVWEKAKPLQNREFVKFIEASLN
jgi:hypothetical protein